MLCPPKTAHLNTPPHVYIPVWEGLQNTVQIYKQWNNFSRCSIAAVAAVVSNSAPCQITTPLVLVGLGVGVGEGLGLGVGLWLGNQVSISTRGGNNLAGGRKWAQHWISGMQCLAAEKKILHLKKTLLISLSSSWVCLPMGWEEHSFHSLPN